MTTNATTSHTPTPWIVASSSDFGERCEIRSAGQKLVAGCTSVAGSLDPSFDRA